MLGSTLLLHAALGIHLRTTLRFLLRLSLLRLHSALLLQLRRLACLLRATLGVLLGASLGFTSLRFFDRTALGVLLRPAALLFQTTLLLALCRHPRVLRGPLRCSFLCPALCISLCTNPGFLLCAPLRFRDHTPFGLSPTHRLRMCALTRFLVRAPLRVISLSATVCVETPLGISLARRFCPPSFFQLTLLLQTCLLDLLLVLLPHLFALSLCTTLVTLGATPRLLLFSPTTLFVRATTHLPLATTLVWLDPHCNMTTVANPTTIRTDTYACTSNAHRAVVSTTAVKPTMNLRTRRAMTKDICGK